MLHLARRIAFGVNVRDLLELQRAFQSDRKVDAAPQVEKISRAEKLFREFFDVVRVVQEVLDLDRQLRQLLRVMTRLVRREHPAQLTEVEAEEVERDHLRGESL